MPASISLAATLKTVTGLFEAETALLKSPLAFTATNLI